MVRLDKQTDFHFPFIAKDNPPLISDRLDLGDKVLASFALSFFFLIIFAVSVDGTTITNHPSIKKNNLVSAPFLLNDNSLAKVQDYKNLNLEKIKLDKQKIATKKKATQPEKQLSKNSKLTRTNNNKFPNKKKPTQTKKTTNLIPIQKPINSKNAIYNSSAKTMVTPKPIFVDNHSEEEKLKINKRVTEDLLPLSYFHAKKKAIDDNKPLLLKFGAKWCLPCKQMEKTTFKNEEVKKELHENYITLNIDVDDFDGFNLSSYFNVQVFPTILIFDPLGNFDGKYTNYLSASRMLNILQKHHPEKVEPTNPNLSNLLADTKESYYKIESQPSIDFQKIILSKKRNGNTIQNLKAKARNWRYTSLTFSTQNITEGELLLKVKETTSGFNLNELKIPLNKNQGIADTTTTRFQLVLEHEKRKKKNGEYVVEIYHVAHDNSKLVGTTTLLKDGEILF